MLVYMLLISHLNWAYRYSYIWKEAKDLVGLTDVVVPYVMKTHSRAE